MIYLSRLLLDPSEPAVQRDLVDCQGMHRTILRAFPNVDHASGSGARAAHGVLYRVETSPDGRVEVLVQSRVQPDWQALPPRYLHGSTGAPAPAASKDVGQFFAALRVGQALQFRLRANATKRVGAANVGEAERWHGKRVELRREEDLLAWLQRKSGEHGFMLLSVKADAGVLNLQAARGPSVHGRRDVLSGTHRAGRMAFGSVLFDGKMRIVEIERFLAALEGGIGSGKAYGFGLLSVAPVPGRDGSDIP